MTFTREASYICTPFFCRRNVIGIYSGDDFSDTPLIIPADYYDFFAVVMGSIIDGYTLFDDREIKNEDWQNFLFLSSEYLSSENYTEFLEKSDERLSDWLRINGEILWRNIEGYRIILARLLSWTEQNVSEGGVKIKGI